MEKIEVTQLQECYHHHFCWSNNQAGGSCSFTDDSDGVIHIKFQLDSFFLGFVRKTWGLVVYCLPVYKHIIRRHKCVHYHSNNLWRVLKLAAVFLRPSQNFLNCASKWMLWITYRWILMICLPLVPQKQDYLVHIAAIVDWTFDPCVHNKVTTSVSTVLKPVCLVSAAHWCCNLLFPQLPRTKWSIFSHTPWSLDWRSCIGLIEGWLFCNFYPCSMLLVHGDISEYWA